MLNNPVIRKNCRHFKGNVPCSPHKKEGVKCENCIHYDQINYRILIIKLGAIGDVIRTTPLLTRLKAEHPGSEITWLTYTPEILPSCVDYPLRFDTAGLAVLLGDSFDLLINLDKDHEAISLGNVIRAKRKLGFKMDHGKCCPINIAARDKYYTGIYDDLNKANTKSYLEEIFEICGYIFNGEHYILELKSGPAVLPVVSGQVIGLNTGCGKRWVTRLWSEDNWVELTNLIRKAGATVLLLGGYDEDAQNRRIAEVTGAVYGGVYQLIDFMHVVNLCDLVVTQVTMALHIAIGLRKKIVLLNNIFNAKEFELYGLGEIIEPPVSCKGCFRTTCEICCMDEITPTRIFSLIQKLQSGV